MEDTNGRPADTGIYEGHSFGDDVVACYDVVGCGACAPSYVEQAARYAGGAWDGFLVAGYAASQLSDYVRELGAALGDAGGGAQQTQPGRARALLDGSRFCGHPACAVLPSAPHAGACGGLRA